MHPFEIKIDNKSYEYIDSKVIDKKNYVLYSDDNNLYISEFEIVNNQIILKEVDPSLIKRVKEAFNIAWN